MENTYIETRDEYEDNWKEEEEKGNFQLKKEVEEFEIIIVGLNFLVLKNKEGNNLRVKCPNTSLFSKEEKIYKENGKFAWEKKYLA